MKKGFLLVIFAVVFRCCLVGQSPDQLGIQKLMNSINDAAEKQDAKAYASFFGPSAVWDGPFGDNTIGPTNIEKLAHLMFTSFGPLKPVLVIGRSLAPDVQLVDVYQTMRIRAEDLHSAPESLQLPPGSIGPPHRSAVRTTLIFQKQNDQWRITAARVADLRIRRTEPKVATEFQSSPGSLGRRSKPRPGGSTNLLLNRLVTR